MNDRNNTFTTDFAAKSRESEEKLVSLLESTGLEHWEAVDLLGDYRELCELAEMEKAINEYYEEN